MKRRTAMGLVASATLSTWIGTASAEDAKAAQKPKAGEWSDADAVISLSSEDGARGDRTAPVTLVMFGDFQCPYCEKLSHTVAALEKKYGKSKLRVVWKHKPLSPMHPQALNAAIASATVLKLKGAAAFWSYSAALFKNQRELTEQKIASLAKAVGVSEKVFAAELAKGYGAEKVKQDLELCDKIKVTATPTSFVNGLKISGAQKAEQFQALIDAELAATKDMVKNGTKADRVYVERCNTNFVPPATTGPSRPPIPPSAPTPQPPPTPPSRNP